MRKLLLLSQFFPPETNAGANRIGPMAEALGEHYDVTVVTLRPGYPSPEEYRDVVLEREDTGHGYEVRRAFAFSPHKGSLPLRTLREQAMAVRLATRALALEADLVVASSPSMFLGPVALALARSKGAKFIWDVRDITWGYAKDAANGSAPMALAARSLESYMLATLRRADLVVGASSGITRMVIESGVDPERAITVPNGISTVMLADIARGVGEAATGGRPTVAYAGVIGYNQGLETLLSVAETLPEADFVLAGDGPELPRLKREAVERGLCNVIFKGYLGTDDLIRVYQESDILFAQARSTPIINATMIPVKLFEYMATGRPVVYAGRGIAADLLDGLGCAVTVAPGEVRAISSAIAGLMEDPERRQRLGSRGRGCVQHDFHRERLMREMALSLERLVLEKESGSRSEQAHTVQ